MTGAVWHRDGLPTAAMHVDTWDVLDDLKATVSSTTPIDLVALRDVDVPLASVVAASPQRR